MFEIRIICDPADRDRVTAALADTFTLGAAREYPSRDGRARLYITADHQAAAETWPTPEQAYAKAPSTISEIGWTARAATDRAFGQPASREFWLRKAALLDRIALRDETAGDVSDATEAAEQAAYRLIDTDGATPTHNPRGYVRQEYARWTTTHP
jgi:hypothetical protein